MAKQRRLNKNVIAAITMGGIVLAILVVGLAAFNASRRDPEVIARKAKAQEEAGDWRRAMRMYQSAYRVKNEAKYLLEGARVARQAGDLGNSFGLLNTAYAQSPDDPAVLNPLLRLYWEIRDLPLGTGHWAEMLERADHLLKPDKEPDNPLALATRLEALEWLRMRPEEKAQRTIESDETLEKILKLDVNDPYIALARAQRARLRVQDELQAILTRGDNKELERFVQHALEERRDLLLPAVAAHPEQIELRVTAASTLAELKNWTDAQRLLEEGLQYTSEQQHTEDPDLHFELARVILQEIEQAIVQSRQSVASELEGIPFSEARPRLEAAQRAAIDPEKTATGLKHAVRALELEPALYRAYRIRADLQKLVWEQDGSWADQRLEKQRSLMESYSEALRSTINLESLRAVLATFRQERLDLISAAFDTAMRFHHETDDQPTQAQALAYLRSYLQEAEAQYPEQAQTFMMKGMIAIIDREDRQAVKAFTEAEKQAEKAGATLLSYRAKEELAKLHRTLGEPGLALKYLEEVIDFLQKDYQNPAPELQFLRVNLLMDMDRASEALQTTENLLIKFPNWPDMRAAHARALTMLGKSDQALQILGNPDEQDPMLMAAKADTAAAGGDYETATRLYSLLLERNPNSTALLDRFLRALDGAGRREEALAYVNQRIEAGPDPKLERTLQAYRILYSEKDPEVRQQKQLELIAAIPDEFERATALFNFWTLRQQTENAQVYLDQMSQLRPDEIDVLRMQFEMALRAPDCEKAERFSRRLTELNADQVGGALYRGRYLLACGDAERALAEFRTAATEYPNDSELKRYTARALIKVNPPRYDEAIKLLTEAVDFDPQNFDARKLLYACYELAGRSAEGVLHLEKAAELAKQRGIKDPFIEERAQYLEEEKNPQTGIELREKTRAEKPNDVPNLLRLTELYEKMGELESARQRLTEAVAAEPNKIDVIRAAVVFYANHNFTEAGETLLHDFLASCQGLNQILGRVLLGRFYELLGNNALVAARENMSAGLYEQAQAEQKRVTSYREKALVAFQQAQDQLAVAMTGKDEKERREAAAICASELAGYYRRMERWEDMIEANRAVLSHLDPQDVGSIQNARLNIIIGLRALRRYAEALEAVRSFRVDYPENMQGIVSEVELLMSGMQRTDQEMKTAQAQARELLTKLTNVNPSDAWAWYRLAEIDAQQERYTDARDKLLHAKELAPEGLRLVHRTALARLYEILGRPELAEAELRELLPLNRGGTRDVELRLVDLFQRTNQLQRALEFVNQLRARDPQQPFWSYQLGKLLIEQKEYSAAARELQTTVELTSSNNPKVIEDWLKALLLAQRTQEVASIFERLNPAVLSPPIKALAAEAYQANNRPEIAVPLLEQAISEGGRFGLQILRDVTQRSARILGMEECTRLIHRLLDGIEDPGLKAGLRLTLAELFIAEGNPARLPEAETILAELRKGVAADDPLNFEILQAQALLLDRQQKAEEAAKNYEAALELRPDDLRTLNNLAYLLADRLGRPDEALPYAQRLHEVAANNPTVLDTVGWVYFLAGNSEQALTVFQEAVRLAPDYIAVQYHLGLVLERLNRKSEALQELNRALELTRVQKDDEYLKQLEEAIARLR